MQKIISIMFAFLELCVFACARHPLPYAWTHQSRHVCPRSAHI